MQTVKTGLVTSSIADEISPRVARARAAFTAAAKMFPVPLAADTTSANDDSTARVSRFARTWQYGGRMHIIKISYLLNFSIA